MTRRAAPSGVNNEMQALRDTWRKRCEDAEASVKRAHAALDSWQELWDNTSARLDEAAAVLEWLASDDCEDLDVAKNVAHAMLQRLRSEGG